MIKLYLPSQTWLSPCNISIKILWKQGLEYQESIWGVRMTLTLDKISHQNIFAASMQNWKFNQRPKIALERKYVWAEEQGAKLLLLIFCILCHDRNCVILSLPHYLEQVFLNHWTFGPRDCCQNRFLLSPSLLASGHWGHLLRGLRGFWLVNTGHVTSMRASDWSEANIISLAVTVFRVRGTGSRFCQDVLFVCVLFVIFNKTLTFGENILAFSANYCFFSTLAPYFIHQE